MTQDKGTTMKPSEEARRRVLERLRKDPGFRARAAGAVVDEVRWRIATAGSEFLAMAEAVYWARENYVRIPWEVYDRVLDGDGSDEDILALEKVGLLTTENRALGDDRICWSLDGLRSSALDMLRKGKDTVDVP